MDGQSYQAINGVIIRVSCPQCFPLSSCIGADDLPAFLSGVLLPVSVFDTMENSSNLQSLNVCRIDVEPDVRLFGIK